MHDLVRQGDGKSMVTTLSSEDKMWSKAYGEPAKRKDIFKKETVKEEPLPSKLKHSRLCQRQKPDCLLKDTLATWNDPNGIYANVSDKNNYKLNTDLEVYDADGNLVHPSNYHNVLLPGAWVIFDAHIRL